MKNSQQQLIIDDLNYCDTVCDDTEAIVGGADLWNAIVGTFEAKWNATTTSFSDFFKYGIFPTGQTANDLFEPIEWSIFRRLF
jgi:hypothetical protein